MSLGTIDDIIAGYTPIIGRIFDKYLESVIKSLKKSGEEIDLMAIFSKPKFKTKKLESSLSDAMMLAWILGSAEEGRREVSPAGIFDWGMKKSLDFIKKTGSVTSGEIRRVDKLAKTKAKEIADGMLKHVNEKIDKVLTRAYVKGGRKTEKFIIELKKRWGDFGVGSKKSHYIHVVLDTATTASHRAAMKKQQEKNAAARPYWTYVTAGDDRVRASHAAMHGKTYRFDDPIWKVWYPPNGWNCRCSISSSATGKESPYPLEMPDEGFAGPPEDFF